jgi:uncharacterized protein with HEPN domain
MPNRNRYLPFHHMLDHAREAVTLVRGKSRADVDDDRLLELALVRLLEVIGEAASRVPDEDRTRYPGIPWPQIVGLRNRLIHGYDAVDMDILWQIIEYDLPPLIAALETILSQEEAG